MHLFTIKRTRKPDGGSVYQIGWGWGIIALAALATLREALS